MHLPALTRVLPNVDPQEAAVPPAREPATPDAAASTATLIIDIEAATSTMRLLSAERRTASLGPVKGAVFSKSTLKACASRPMEVGGK